MRKKSKLRLLSWITTIAMILSIFNIPLVGYATESADPSTSSEVETYMVVGSGFYVEGEDHEVGDSDEWVCEECGNDPCTCVSAKIYYSLNNGAQIEDERFYGIEHNRNIELPYSYDGNGITLIAEYYFPETDEYIEDTVELDVDGSGEYPFILSNEEEYILDVYINEEFSEDINAEIVMNILDRDSVYVSCDEMNEGEDGIRTYEYAVPYGYNELSFAVNTYSPGASVAYDNLTYDSDEAFYTVNISAGAVTREFTVVAEDGETEKTYRITFNESTGDSTDASVEAYYYVTYDHPEYGSYRSVDVVFEDSDTEVDENGNPIAVGKAEVSSLYDGEGIRFNINSEDAYIQWALDEEGCEITPPFETGETAIFTVTSANGENSKTYWVELVEESEEVSKYVGFEEFTVSYTDAEGEVVTEDVDLSQASGDGAVFTFDEETVGNNFNEYGEFYVNVYAKTAKNNAFTSREINANSYDSDSEDFMIDYNIDVCEQGVASVILEVTNMNGYSKTYTVKLINEVKAADPEISGLDIEYTGVNDAWYYEWIELDNGKGEYTLRPYYTDEDNPIIVLGYSADGTPIEEKIYAEDFVDGKYVFTVVSKSFVGKDGNKQPEQKDYTITLYEPSVPMVEIIYKDKWNGEGEDDFTSMDCEIKDDNTGKIRLPYSSKDVSATVTFLNGKMETFEPVWNEENTSGTIKFTDENGVTYTVMIDKELPSDSTEIYVELYAYYSEDEDDFTSVYFESWDFNDNNELTITIPKDALSTELYVGAYGKGELSSGERYIENVEPGTFNYTVTAEDGVTSEDYTVIVKKSEGNSTAVNMSGTFKMEGYGYRHSGLYFEDEAGTMVANYALPYNYDEEEGVCFFNNSFEKVTIEGDFVNTGEGIGTLYPSDENGWSFDFIVTAADGKTKQSYRIDFVKENEKDAKTAEIEYLGVYYKTADQKTHDYEVDLTKAVNGNIEVHIPELDDYDGYIDIEVVAKGFGTITKVSDADYNYFEYGSGFAGFYAESIKDKAEFSFDIKSSDGSSTKSYNIIVKPNKGTNNAHMANWDNGKTDEATCTEEGSTIYSCKAIGCGEQTVVTIPAKKHDYVKTVTAPTCTEKGYTTYTCKHDATHTYKDNYENPTGHSHTAVVTAPTCTEAGYTTYTCACGDTYKADEVAATGHKFGEYTTTEKAGFDKEGEQTAICSVCQAKDTKTIAAAVVPVIKDITYNGKNKTPVVTVKNTDGTKITSTKKFIKKTRKVVGKYGVKVTINNANYESTKTIYFKIVPAAKSISKLTAGKKAFTVKWKKATSKNRAQMTGYQIRYSTSSKMSGAKTVTVKSKTATTKTIKKLKAKKTYYVQLRTYKTIKGVKYCSSWSSAKKIKTK